MSLVLRYAHLLGIRPPAAKTTARSVTAQTKMLPSKVRMRAPSFLALLGTDFKMIETAGQREAKRLNRFQIQTEPTAPTSPKASPRLTPKELAAQIIAAGEKARGKPYYAHEAIKDLMARAKTDHVAGNVAAIIQAAAKARGEIV